jgi:hypothetical protein
MGVSGTQSLDRVDPAIAIMVLEGSQWPHCVGLVDPVSVDQQIVVLIIHAGINGDMIYRIPIEICKPVVLETGNEVLDSGRGVGAAKPYQVAWPHQTGRRDGSEVLPAARQLGAPIGSRRHIVEQVMDYEMCKSNAV